MRIITSVTAGAVALFLASATAHAAATNISATQSTIKYSNTSTASFRLRQLCPGDKHGRL